MSFGGSISSRAECRIFAKSGRKVFFPHRIIRQVGSKLTSVTPRSDCNFMLTMYFYFSLHYYRIILPYTTYITSTYRLSNFHASYSSCFIPPTGLDSISQPNCLTAVAEFARCARFSGNSKLNAGLSILMLLNRQHVPRRQLR